MLAVVLVVAIFFGFEIAARSADPYAVPIASSPSDTPASKETPSSSGKTDGYDLGHLNKGSESSPPVAPAQQSAEVRELQEEAARKQLAADRATESAQLQAQAEAKEQQADVLKKEAEVDRERSEAAKAESDRLTHESVSKAPPPGDGGYVEVGEDGELKPADHGQPGKAASHSSEGSSHSSSDSAGEHGKDGKGAQEDSAHKSKEKEGDAHKKEGPHSASEKGKEKNEKEESPIVSCSRETQYSDPVCERENGQKFNQVTGKEIKPADGGYINQDAIDEHEARKKAKSADGGYENVDEHGNVKLSAEGESHHGTGSHEEKAKPADGGYVNVDEHGNVHAIDEAKSDSYHNVDEEGEIRKENRPEAESKKDHDPRETLHCEKKGVKRKKVCTRADGSTYDEATGKELSPATRSDEEAKRLAQIKKESEGDNPTVECNYKSSFSTTRTCRRADGSEYNEKTGKQTKPPTHTTGAAGQSDLETRNPTLKCEKKGFTRSEVCTRADGSTYDPKSGKQLSGPTKTSEETKEAAEAFHAKKSQEKSKTVSCKYEGTFATSRTCVREDGSTYNEKTGKEIKPPKPVEDPDNPTIKCVKDWKGKEMCERADGSTYDPKSHKEGKPATRSAEEARQIAAQHKEQEEENPTVSCVYKKLSSTRVCTRKDGSTYNEKTGKVLSSPKTDKCEYENPESRTRTCTRPDGTKYDEASGADLDISDEDEEEGEGVDVTAGLGEEEDPDDEDNNEEGEDPDEGNEDEGLGNDHSNRDEDDPDEDDPDEDDPDDEDPDDGLDGEDASDDGAGQPRNIGKESDFDGEGDADDFSDEEDDYGSQGGGEADDDDDDDDDRPGRESDEQDQEEEEGADDGDEDLPGDEAFPQEDVFEAYRDPKKIKWGGASGDQQDVGGSTGFLGDENLETQVISGKFDRVTVQNANPIVPLKDGYVQVNKRKTGLNPYRSGFMTLKPMSRYDP